MSDAGALERIRPWAVVAALPVTILMALLGGGAVGGLEVENASGGALASDATPLAPAGPAFSIWTLIYVGLAAYAIWQALPAQRRAPRHRAIGWLAVASLVLNAVWIICALAGLLPLTVVVIALLLAVLVAIFEALRRHPAAGALDHVLTDGTFGLYLGWVCVATIANVAALLADLGWRPDAWQLGAVLVLGVAAVVAIALAIRGEGRFAPSLAIVWGVAWIGVARLTGEPASVAIAIAAAAVCVAVGIATVAARMRATPAAA